MPQGLAIWAAVLWATAFWSAASAAERYLGPSALTVSNDGKTLYVACSDARQVAWIALPEGRITRRVSVPGRPTDVALSPDGAKLVVSCAAAKSVVAVFDAASGRRVAAISAGHTAGGLVFGPRGRRGYVCNRFDNDVSVIDLADGKEITRVAVVREPIAAALTPDGRTLLVANHLPAVRTHKVFVGDVTPAVSSIDTQTFAVTTRDMPHGAHSLRGIAVSPDGKFALVTHLLSNFERVPSQVNTGWISTNVVSILDLPDGKLRSTIGVDEYYLGAGNPCDVAFAAGGEKVCVSLSGTHQLAVIDTSDLLGDFAYRTMRPMMAVWPIYISLGESLWKRRALSGKGPRGIAVAGSKVYVAQYFSDSVAVHDLETPDGRPQSTIALGPPPKLTIQRRGELLFHDATICYQRWQSCASCHPDARIDGLNWDLMNDGVGNPKNTKSMLFSHRTPPAMAEGVRPSAEVAVRSGLTHILFANRPEEEAAAIDAYLDSLRPVPSPHLVDGRLSASAERGRELFFSRRIGCRRCHPPPLYTDLDAYDVGTRREDQRGEEFDTPTLIEVWRTAPYLHDGRYLTVRELLVEGRHGLKGSRGDGLSEREIDDLVEFVLSL